METGPQKLLFDAVRILNKLKVKYFITGGFAVSVWGRIRSTIDIDIVIELIESKIEFLIKELRTTCKDGYVNEDIAKEAARTQGEFNFINPYIGMKIDFWIARDSKKAKLEYRRRRTKTINGKKVYFISPEDLILNKLIWAKETQSDYHLQDAKSVLDNSTIDLKYIKQQAKIYEITKILNEILAK